MCIYQTRNQLLLIWVLSSDIFSKDQTWFLFLFCAKVYLSFGVTKYRNYTKRKKKAKKERKGKGKGKEDAEADPALPRLSFQGWIALARRDVGISSKSLHTSTAMEAIPAPSSPLPSCQAGLGFVLRAQGAFSTFPVCRGCPGSSLNPLTKLSLGLGTGCWPPVFSWQGKKQDLAPLFPPSPARILYLRMQSSKFSTRSWPAVLKPLLLLGQPVLSCCSGKSFSSPLHWSKRKGHFISSWSRSEVWKVPAEPLCQLSSYQGALTAGVGINPGKVAQPLIKNSVAKGHCSTKSGAARAQNPRKKWANFWLLHQMSPLWGWLPGASVTHILKEQK